MRLETIKKLCCPFDKADLELTIITKNVDGNIVEGYLYCNDCKRIYPIVSSIPIMSPDEYRDFKLEQPLLERWTNTKITNNFRIIDFNSVKNDD